MLTPAIRATKLSRYACADATNAPVNRPGASTPFAEARLIQGIPAASTASVPSGVRGKGDRHGHPAAYEAARPRRRPHPDFREALLRPFPHRWVRRMLGEDQAATEPL